jgi:hypothetical protein
MVIRKSATPPSTLPSNKNNMANEQVLVTGGSGFIGAHCILQLLDAGYRVGTTVRSLKREPDVRAMLETGGVSPSTLDRLTFFVADLEKEAGWPEAVDRCDYVLHVASPLPPSVPKHEDELISPAREGTFCAPRAMPAFAALCSHRPSPPSATGTATTPRPSTKPIGRNSTATCCHILTCSRQRTTKIHLADIGL